MCYSTHSICGSGKSKGLGFENILRDVLHTLTKPVVNTLNRIDQIDLSAGNV